MVVVLFEFMIEIKLIKSDGIVLLIFSLEMEGLMNKQKILLNKISELFEQISQLQMSFNDIINIVNYQNMNKEVAELLIKHAKQGQEYS